LYDPFSVFGPLFTVYGSFMVKVQRLRTED